MHHEVPGLGTAYDGVELSLKQLLGAPSMPLRAVCRLEPESSAEASRQLDELATHLARGNPQSVELIVIKAPSAPTLQDQLSYMRAVLPHSAQFLEAHPSVGRCIGKLTGHGTPVPTHVLGVCHEIAGRAPLLAELCDIFPVTRLSLRASNLAGDKATTACQVTPAAGLSDEMHTMLLSTDHVTVGRLTELDAMGSLWEEMWCMQQLEGAAETFATVRLPVRGARTADDRQQEELVAERVRRHFAASAAWRAGAGERRATEARETARSAQQEVLTLWDAPVAEAARSFGIDLSDGRDALNVRAIKERWRQLALEQHPDLTGGGPERFVQLRRHLQVLLRACRSVGTSPTRL